MKHAAPLAVDLRSDTVTQPTEAMYACMRQAPLGDDGLEGDPTVSQLERQAADRFGKEAGLFVSSGTLGNLLAILAQTGRAGELLCEAQSHLYNSEKGGATFTGLFYRPIAGDGGAMRLDVLEEALFPAGGYKLKSALITVETSHNHAGGTVLPLDHLQGVQALAHRAGVPVHLDGARVFNAAVAMGRPVSDIAACVDSLSFCLSKGLSAPVGSVLLGSRAMIDRARALRRMLGGTMRQAGVLAAAGIEAMENMSARLIEDHRQAYRLAEGLRKISLGYLSNWPQTNIVQAEVGRDGCDAIAWVALLEEHGVKVRAIDRQRIRCVLHRHIDDDAVDRALKAFQAVHERLAG